MEIKAEELYGFGHYLYGEAYFGSCHGMRYRVARDPLENVVFENHEKQMDARFKAEVWFTPFCYEKTPDDEKTGKDFPFTEDGLKEAAGWLNTMLEGAAGTENGK